MALKPIINCCLCGERYLYDSAHECLEKPREKSIGQRLFEATDEELGETMHRYRDRQEGLE